MELIRISDRKLKIMLTPTDMCHFELNADSFGEDRTEMHRAFRLLLKEIRSQIDFDADDTHISVQYFPSREGGCEMFISNLLNEEPEYEAVTSPMSTALTPPKESLQVRPFKKHSGSFRKDCAYRFEELKYLLQVCKRLSQIGFITNSTAYKDEKGAYFLFLTVMTCSPFSTPEELDFIVEYGSIENATMLRLYIREHASLICSQNAVSELGRLA